MPPPGDQGPEGREPAVVVGGQPVHHPMPPDNDQQAAGNDDNPAPPAPRAQSRVGARELKGLLDKTYFEKRPENVAPVRRTAMRELEATVAQKDWNVPRSKPPSNPLRPDFIFIPVVDGVECALNTSTVIEPKTLAEALENGTWTLARLPQGKRAIGSRWVFKIKRKADGSIDKYKGRIVAKGYAQREGVDYTETFAPTARFGALRTVIALAAMEDWELESVDISTAFLNGDIDAEVYMRKPEGVEFPGYEGSEWVLRLLKGVNRIPATRERP